MRYIQLTYPSTRGLLAANGLGGRLGGTSLNNELDWLFGAALAGVTGGAQFPVDLYEDKDNTYVRAELPGVNRDAIGVEVIDGSLSIKATRTDKTADGEKSVSLSRLVGIPEGVQADKVQAVYENGVLTVTLPYAEAVKPRKINVSVN
jgi:HSP20 family protein